LATRISSLSSGNLWRRVVLTYFKCSGLPHSLEGVSVLCRKPLPKRSMQRHWVWHTREQERRGGLLFLWSKWMKRETLLRSLPYRYLTQRVGAVLICFASPPEVVRNTVLSDAANGTQLRPWRHAMGVVSDFGP
jgi:hypothetical protein